MNTASRLRSLPSAVLNRYLAWIYDDMVRERYRAQVSCLEPDPDAILLDIGCQNGRNTQVLRIRLGAKHAYGVDYNQRTLRTAQSIGFRVCVSDANRALPFADGSFTVVTTMDVLEHLIDPKTHLCEIYRVLKNGGYAIIATPNLASWHNIYALLIGRQPFSGPNITTMLDGEISPVQFLHRREYGLSTEPETIPDPEPELHRHLVVTAYRSLLELLRSTGFKVESAEGYGYYPFMPPLSAFLSRLNPSHSHHIVVKARKYAGAACAPVSHWSRANQPL